jgi:LysM repeat protein
MVSGGCIFGGGDDDDDGGLLPLATDTPALPTNTVASTETVAGATTAAPSATSSGEVTYTVVAGDTLGAIAAAHGTTVAAIVAANNIADANAIDVGQVLVIPTGSQ